MFTGCRSICVCVRYRRRHFSDGLAVDFLFILENKVGSFLAANKKPVFRRTGRETGCFCKFTR